MSCLLVVLIQGCSKKPEEAGEVKSTPENKETAVAPKAKPRGEVHSVRTWHNKNGNELEAVYIKFEDDMIYLKGENGKAYRVSINKFTTADQKYVRGLNGDVVEVVKPIVRKEAAVNADASKLKIHDKYTESDYLKRDKNHPEAKVIQQLIAAGADLSKPHNPDFKFDFKDKQGLQVVVKILTAKGYKIQVLPPDEKYPTYGLKANKEMIIEFETMADINDLFRKLAKDNNGELLGWGSPVKK